MQTVHTIAAVRDAVRAVRRAGHRVGFVPTMGNLHDGHLTLFELARESTDFVVGSVFVNPLQFGEDEDYDKYPRTLAKDQAKLRGVGVELLFAPNLTEMYARGMDQPTRVTVGPLGNDLCGAHRIGHFDGMATVVAKLLNIVQADVAVFGGKDYQQLAIIREMVRDLCMPVEIVCAPTARADDGLALSSRNQYLSAAERQVAPKLYAELQGIVAALESGARDFASLEQAARGRLTGHGFAPDYVAIRRSTDLQPAGEDDRELVVLAAARLGAARLIDNLRVSI